MGITNTNTNSRLSSSIKLNGQKLLRYDEKYGSLEKAGVCMDLEPVKNKQQTTAVAAKPIAALNMKQTGNNKPKGLRYDAKYGDLEKAAVLMEPAPAAAATEPARDDDDSSSSAPDYASEKQAGGGMVVAVKAPKAPKAPAHQKKVMDPYESSCLKYDKKYGDLEKAGVLMDF